MVGAELMAASAEVIAARTGRMAQGLTSAKGQDFKELSLMSSEKAEALSRLGRGRDRQRGRHRPAAGAGGDGTRAPMRCGPPAAVTQARTPAQAAEAQFRYAMGWWSRAAAQAMTLNGELLKAQAEAMAPIHKTAVANAKRLRKKT